MAVSELKRVRVLLNAEFWRSEEALQLLSLGTRITWVIGLIALDDFFSEGILKALELTN
jgi:hypothetical protein